MSPSADLRARCVEVFSRVFGAEAGSITDTSSPENLEAWDSLGHVQLVVELEKAFGVEIAPDEGLEIETFRNVIDLLERKGR